MKSLITLAFVSIAMTTMAVEVSLTPTDATCSQCNGSIQSFASGGLPPYSFLWSPAPPSGQGSPAVSGLCPGDYTVEVTDGLGNTAQATVTINAQGGLGNNLYAQQVQHDCAGGCTGWAFMNQMNIPGTPPYTYGFPFPQYDMFGSGSVAFAGLCPGETAIPVTDANGCTGTIQTSITSSPISSPGILGTSPACGNLGYGSITMEGGGPGANTAYRIQSATFDSLYVLGEVIGPCVLGGIPPGDHAVGIWWVNGDITGMPNYAYCTNLTDFTIASLPDPCGSIAGRVYHDADETCTFNGFDIGLPYRVLSIEPGNEYTISDAAGFYQHNLAFDTYTIQQTVAPDEVALCPPSGSEAFTLESSTPQATIDFANLSTVPHDLSVGVTSTTARPGFGTQVWLTVVNHSAFPSGQVNITLSYDAILLAPSNASWTLPAIEAYGSRTFTFTANVPADIGLLGSTLNYSATVTNMASEVNTVNNAAFIDVIITGSYDPNDKQGRTSSRISDTFYFLDADDHIDYTIRFQNTGTATAETVVIRDTLDTDLDLTSLQILGASHTFTPSFGESRELVFTFNGIDLPDSTSDLLGSQGFISYRIKPENAISVGTVIENTANIYFDFNPPVITEPSVLVAEFSTGVNEQDAAPFALMPNPTNGLLYVRIREGAGVSLQVIATDGSVIDVPLSRNADGIQLDVRSLAAGVYVVRTAEGSARFVKR